MACNKGHVFLSPYANISRYSWKEGLERMREQTPIRPGGREGGWEGGRGRDNEDQG